MPLMWWEGASFPVSPMFESELHFNPFCPDTKDHDTVHGGCFSPAAPCCWGSRRSRPPSRWSRDQRSRLVTRRTGRLCGATTGPLRRPETGDALIRQRSATTWANKTGKIVDRSVLCCVLTGLRHSRWPPSEATYSCLREAWRYGEENTAPPPQWRLQTHCST